MMALLVGLACFTLFPVAIMFLVLWFRFIIVLADTLSPRDAWNESFALIGWIGRR